MKGAATRIALSTVKAWLDEHDSNMLVRFCCFSSQTCAVYRRTAEELHVF